VLLLFDIDGTLLLRAFDAHRRALDAALCEAYDLRDLRSARISAAGRTDLEIARALLLANDVSADRIDERLDDFRALAAERYAELCEADLSARVAPGISSLVESLAARDDVRLSLVTGNLEPIARLKLARAGIGKHFPTGQGGFGSDHEDRAALPAIARRRAGENGSPYPRARTLVIGDTPRDIACAHADGVRCIAVATGPYGVRDLAQADVVVRDGHVLGEALERELNRLIHFSE
jgi:phosphoglycolate phosphatase-like HAD superfamily hydrolase